jgi:hypothetical protein
MTTVPFAGSDASPVTMKVNRAVRLLAGPILLRKPGMACEVPDRDSTRWPFAEPNDGTRI